MATAAELLELKTRRALAISVCLPALDEDDTIGRICSRIREHLIDETHLVDELVVVDSGSSDATVREAEAAGATVHRAGDILPHIGEPRGKGDSLWRSLAVLRGDVVVWLDSDVRNFNESFVGALVEPLLRDPETVLVKAYYDRPLETSEGVSLTGGARVTELVVRPLLQLFQPELTAIVQPLSGEYAGYKAVFEDLAFFTGYGVEIGLLIDVAERFGVERIAQVDLGRRVHRNRDTIELGRTAFEVMQAMFRRFDSQGRLKLAGDLPTSLRQFLRGVDGPIEIATELEVVERPPMRTLRSG